MVDTFLKPTPHTALPKPALLLFKTIYSKFYTVSDCSMDHLFISNNTKVDCRLLIENSSRSGQI